MNETERKKLAKWLTENASLEDIEEMLDSVNDHDNSLQELQVFNHDDAFYEREFADKGPMDLVASILHGDVRESDPHIRIDSNGNVQTYSAYERDTQLAEYADDIIERAVLLYAFGEIDISTIIGDADIND